jgi:thioredoxin reductase (NADPH)
MNSEYQFVIIGAGGTGLAAAMYAGRLGLKTICFGTMSTSEQPIGGVITLTDVVENYPGFIHLTGTELAEKLEQHAREYEVEIYDERVTDVSRMNTEKCFTVTTNKRSVTTKTILFATGSKWKKLPMKGAIELENKGVAYCALCDGPLYKKKKVAVIGGSDSAAKEALFLAEHADKVYIIARSEKLRAEPVNMKLVEQNPKIEVLTETNVIEIVGDKVVEKIILDRPHQGELEIALQGVFGAIGHIPLSELAKKIGVELNDKNEIKINRGSETNIEGVYAAGDVVDTIFKQAITGVAEGVHAAYSAFTYVKENQFVCVSSDDEAEPQA